MKNIFEDAKFGDKFLTRGGQVVVYWHYKPDDEYDMLHYVIFEDGGWAHYRDDGYWDNPFQGKEFDLDIIGRLD